MKICNLNFENISISSQVIGEKPVSGDQFEFLPSDWKEGYKVRVPKKGDLSSCSNYRGITLLSVPSKIFNRVILNRIKDAVDPSLRDNQAGFRKNR